MDLKDFVEKKGSPIPLQSVAADPELVSDIQTQLVSIGLLDPPVDGKFGPVSKNALETLCLQVGLSPADGFSTPVAEALVAGLSANYFPLTPQDNFAGRIVKAMQTKGFWIARHPECINIVYIEGCNPDGTSNENKPNEFNDVRILLSVAKGGVPTIVDAWDASTEPSRQWTINPMEPTGAARIAFGQYKAWAVGTHGKGTKSPHEALVQVDNVSVCRDLNKDFSREGDTVYTGIFGIDQHWGYNYPKNDLRNASAGCLVGRLLDGHQRFMALLKEDPRYKSSNAYKFISTTMPVSALQKS